MKEFIEKIITDAIKQLQNQGTLPETLNYQVQVERCREQKHGDFACNIALTLSKQANQQPRDLAQQIVEHIHDSPKIAKIEIAGPGFINCFLAGNVLQQVVDDVLNAADAYGCSTTGNGKRVHLEFVSANPTGPLHVGHGRSAAYGSCVANLLSAVGYQVHREYYVNDVGRQMRILAVSVWLRYLQSFGESIPLPSNAYQGDYIIAIAQKLKDEHGNAFQKSKSDIEAILPQDTPPKDITDDDMKKWIEKRIDAYVNTMIQLIGDDSFETFRQAALNGILDDIKDDLTEFGVVYDNWFY